MKKWIIANCILAIPMFFCFLATMILGLIMANSDHAIEISERGKTLAAWVGGIGIVGMAFYITMLLTISRYANKIDKLDEETEAYHKAQKEMYRKRDLYVEKLDEYTMKLKELELNPKS